MYVRLNNANDSIASMGVDLRLDMTAIAEPLVEPFSFSGIRLFDLGKELLARINAGYTFESDLLSSDPILSTTFAASGDAIRGIAQAKVKTSWADFKTSVGAMHPYCLQIDTVRKVVRMEDIGQAYRGDVEIVDLGRVDRLSIEPFTDFTHNLVSIGISDPEYSMVNGRLEFNNEFQFKTAVVVISNESKQLSKYRTDSFGVTALRYEAVKSKTADDKSDNSVFVIHCDGRVNPSPYTGHQVLGDGIQLQRTGVFNVGLTPNRCLRRQARRLLSGLYRLPGVLTWLTSSKTSATLESRFRDPVTGAWDHVVEKADVELQGQPLLIPKKVKLTALVPGNLPELMAKNVGGYISFTWRGNRYKGFPLNVTQRPVVNSEQEVTVVLHPETDIL